MSLSFYSATRIVPRSTSLSVVAFCLALLGSAKQTWAVGPFEGFIGSWTGSGIVTMTDGSHEPVRCKSSFKAVNGVNGLAVSVVCASDSYKFNLTTSVAAQGNGFSGSWQEETRQIQGDVQGTIPSPGTLQASLNAMGGGIQIGARANGKQMGITIQSQGTEVQAVNIEFRKR